MQCLCNNQCLTDIVLNKHFVKIEDICENYETVKIVIDSFNILKKQKIRYRFKKKFPKKYNKVIFQEKKQTKFF